MRWRVFGPLFILLAIHLDLAAHTTCDGHLSVESIFAHDLKLSDDALAYLQNIPAAAVYLDSYRRVFPKLTPENLQILSFAAATSTSAIYLYDVFKQPDWQSGDYLTLNELLDGVPATGVLRVPIDDDLNAGSALPAAQVQRLRVILENDRLRQGLRSIYDKSDIPVLVNANRFDLSTLMIADKFDVTTAEQYRRYLDLSSKRLHGMKLPDDALRLYRKLLRLYPLSIIYQLDIESFRLAVTDLGDNKFYLNRHSAFTLLAPILRDLPMALETLDYYYFATKPMTAAALRGLILQNARVRLQNWRAEYTRHLNELNAQKKIPLREMAPIPFEIRDFHPVQTNPRRARPVATESPAPEIDTTTIAPENDFARFCRNDRPLGELEASRVYQFYIRRPGHPGRRQIRFHADAIEWMREHPREADRFIRSILLGGTVGPNSAGIKKLVNLHIPGGGRALEIKSFGNFRARVAMVDHVYQVLSFAHKDKMRTEASSFRPLSR